MSESGILTVHLRDSVPEDALRDELAKLLGIATQDLAPLNIATPATLVPYQYTPRSRGFLVTIEVYAGQLAESAPSSDLALAEHLAKRFAQDALVSPSEGGENPYQWLLVRPDGTTANVAEVVSDDDDDDDGIVVVEPNA